MKEAKQICPTTALGKVNKGALMVDVRNKNEIAEVTFDVSNYINIPLNELEDRINELPKDKEIVMVCQSGERSLRTTYYLMNAGFKNVYNMRDGIEKWALRGYPTKGDTKSLLIDGSCCSQSNCC